MKKIYILLTRWGKDTALMRPNDYTTIPELLCYFQGRLNELLQEQICWAA